MVDAGDIFAQIDASAGMVRFLEDPEAFDSAAAVARIDDAVQRSMALSQRLQAAHRAVCLLCSQANPWTQMRPHMGNHYL